MWHNQIRYLLSVFLALVFSAFFDIFFWFFLLEAFFLKKDTCLNWCYFGLNYGWAVLKKTESNLEKTILEPHQKNGIQTGQLIATRNSLNKF